MVKKSIQLLLVICLIFCLSACGTTEGSNNQTHTQSVSQNDTTQTQPSTNQSSETNQPTHTHSYSNATCTSAATCSCGATSGSALGHDYSGKYCSRCSAQNPNYTETTQSSETNQPTHTHSYSNATCTSAAKCSCGATSGSALGHNYSGKYCSRCSAQNPNYTETTQSSHTHYYSSSVTKEATCGNEGVRTYKCSCGHSYTESISKKNSHNWENATCTSPKKCKVCGVTEGAAKEHSYSALYNYKCDMCGQVDPIVDGALKNSSLKTPELPLTITCYGISECQFNITNIEYEFEYYSNGKVLLNAKFSGSKIYDSKGANHSSACEITWKLYDSNGNVVNSGYQYTPSIVMGEKVSNVEETLLPYYKASNPGVYRLEILTSNR